MRSVGLVAGVLAVILIPFFLWGEQLEAFGQTMLNSARGEWWVGPAIAFLLAADVFLPVPSSILATAAGALLGFAGGTAANLVGMMAGCALGYSAGKAAERAADDRVRKLWERYGEWTVVVARAVPVLAEASVLFAGMTGMNRRRFFLLTTAANAGISLLYAAVGAFAVEWNSFLAAFLGSLVVPAMAQAMMGKRWGK